MGGSKMKQELTKSKSGKTVYFPDKKGGTFEGDKGGIRIWSDGIIANSLEVFHKKRKGVN